MLFQDTIAIIHTQFGPYHFARAKAIAKLYSGKVRLIQLASKEIQRDWVVDVEQSELITIAQGTLESIHPNVIARQLVKCLNEILPNVLVIAGYAHPAMRYAALWAKSQGIARILLSDSQQQDRPRNFITEGLKGIWICRNFDAAFVAGANAALYLNKLGFPLHNIWRGYDVVNNHHFALESERIKGFTPEQRDHFGVPKKFFLYVGRFSPEKNLLRLLLAYKLYRQQLGQEAWSLVMVGGGPQEAKLRAQAQQLNLLDVIWPGFQQVDKLPIYYGLASALILPSLREPWGLVINEGMACGLPILISERCGCVPDLVFPGINGYVFNPFRVEQIAAAMAAMTAKSDLQRHKMGNASSRIIANYTPETWAEALSDCIHNICV
ncbi:glycosyltransferase [Anabaena subtropica]|uniref:Glycosyltransferase family 4 protein n=1 Tax=Anabaena subtropica FACHB-260 TaxID=2692884 RepID=A0ABR8CLY5_9NOST|nr:glycosyltransferase [Anabaena subtropica]MBD2343428.1 glycosyltransferase family 4 protein [Anabaena subtropica FACHB-260]